jgi:putative lipoic acid-binding regulatory protein
MIDLNDQKLELNYPVKWGYRVIGKDEGEIILAIEQICESREYKYNRANQSSKGKFLSFHLEVLVHNDDDRTELFQSLQSHEKINYVL